MVPSPTVVTARMWVTLWDQVGGVPETVGSGAGSGWGSGLPTGGLVAPGSSGNGLPGLGVLGEVTGGATVASTATSSCTTSPPPSVVPVNT